MHFYTLSQVKFNVKFSTCVYNLPWLVCILLHIPNILMLDFERLSNPKISMGYSKFKSRVGLKRQKLTMDSILETILYK